MQQNTHPENMSAARTQPAVVRIMLIILGVFCTVEVALVIVPFFANGIHLVDAYQVYLGYYDPKSYFPYNKLELLLITASLIHFVLRPLIVPLIILTGFFIIRRRQHLDRRVLITYVCLVAATALVIAFFTTSTGELATTWIHD